MSKNRLNIAVMVYSRIIFEGLYSVLSQSELDCNIYKVDSLEELDDALQAHPVDLLITNPMQLVNREKEVKKVRKKYPELAVVAINLGVVDNSLMSLFDASFTIFDPMEKVIYQIKKAHDNGETSNTSNSDNLTEREIHVLTKVVHGLSNKEIGESLNISVHTVVTHRKNITAKTGIRSESGLTIYALSKKIISMEDIDLNKGL